MSWRTKERHKDYTRKSGQEATSYKVDFVASWSAFLVLGIAGVMMYSFTLAAGEPSLQNLAYTSNYLTYMLLLVAGMFGTFIVVSTATKCDCNYEPWQLTPRDETGKLSFNEPIQVIVLGFGTALLVFLMSSVIHYAPIAVASGPMQWMIIVPVLMAGVAETFWAIGLFYGAVNRFIVDWLGWEDSNPLTFIVSGMPSSVIFSIGHWAASNYAVQVFAFAFMFNWIFLLLYWSTHKLGVPIAAHVAWDFFMLIQVGIIALPFIG